MKSSLRNMNTLYQQFLSHFPPISKSVSCHHCDFQSLKPILFSKHINHEIVSLAFLLSESRPYDQLFSPRILWCTTTHHSFILPISDLVISRCEIVLLPIGLLSGCRALPSRTVVLTASTIHLCCLISPGTPWLLHTSNIHAWLVFHHILQVAFSNYLQPLKDLSLTPSYRLFSIQVVFCITEENETTPTQLLQFPLPVPLLDSPLPLAHRKMCLCPSCVFFHLPIYIPLLYFSFLILNFSRNFIQQWGILLPIFF